MSFTVYKLNYRGEEELSYTGEVIERGEHHVCIRATYRFATRDLGYMTLRKGDHFTEWFYDDRWYNIFRITDVESGMLKGFYCNLTRPAQITETHVKADDLALDIFVKPDGEWLLLDEEEYEALQLPESERAQVQQAIEQIKFRVQQRKAPFDEIP